ncbi:MAG: hypothetical protein V4629_13380 [Pseudomonadota bacterium]
MFLRFPIIMRCLVILLVVDALAITITFFIPEHFFLKAYLSERAEQSIQRFFKEESAVLPDELLGWKTKPNINKDYWKIASDGSRDSGQTEWEKTEVSKRVLFLGNSLINGGEGVTNRETISASLEEIAKKSNQPIATKNFATMAYGLDQSVLQYREQLHSTQAQWIVVGLNEDVNSALTNQFLPFRIPDEDSLPFLKPQFYFANAKYDLAENPANISRLKTVLQDSNQAKNLLQSISEQDAYYSRFKSFSHFNWMPLSRGISTLARKTETLKSYFFEQEKNYVLAQSILNHMNDLAQERNAKVIFVYLPSKQGYARSGVWNYLPDYYAQRLAWLQNSGVTILDGREMLKKSNGSIEPSDLYIEDALHFTAEANKKFAEILWMTIKQ